MMLIKIPLYSYSQRTLRTIFLVTGDPTPLSAAHWYTCMRQRYITGTPVLGNIISLVHQFEATLYYWHTCMRQHYINGTPVWGNIISLVHLYKATLYYWFTPWWGNIILLVNLCETTLYHWYKCKRQHFNTGTPA